MSLSDPIFTSAAALNAYYDEITVTDAEMDMVMAPFVEYLKPRALILSSTSALGAKP